MRVDEGQGGSGRKSSGSEKEYVKWTYQYSGGQRWLYAWYYQYGVLKFERTLAPEKKTAPAKKTKPKPQPKPKSKPKAVPQPPPKPKVGKKPTFTMEKPTAPDKFKFNMKEPVKREVLVPAPAPNPGPAPTFNFEEQKNISKYEYVYGIKHLEVKHKQYNPGSIFVSKPIKVEGNVMQLSLHAVEEHPVFDGLSGKAADRQTSVEYYVSYTDADWFPILPEDQQFIKAELMMFDTAKTAKLRFPAKVSGAQRATVYKDQVELDRSLWSFSDGGTKVQLLTDRDPKAIYTVDYTPNVDAYNPWLIDVSAQGARVESHTDVFPDGTNHNKTVMLTHYPYVDYGKVNGTADYDPNLSEYKPISVKLTNAGIAGPNRTSYKEVLPYSGSADQKVFTKNVSDYKTGEWKELKPYSLKDEDAYNGFEYYQEGNKVYLSETFNKADIHVNTETQHGNAQVEVTYQYLVSNFRIKMILRRNSADVNTLTPIVHEYALKFKVMK